MKNLIISHPLMNIMDFENASGVVTYINTGNAPTLDDLKFLL